MTRERAASAALIAFLLAAGFDTGCAPALMKLPEGAGVAATDAPRVLQQATAACGALSTFSAEVAVSGSIDARKIPRVRLILGAAAPASARIEATSPFAGPLFVMTARDNDASLLVSRDNRVLSHSTPEAVIEALSGVPIDAADLRKTLTGCPLGPTLEEEGRQLDEDWRMFLDGSGTIYLHRDQGTWRLVASARHSLSVTTWRAEYQDFNNGLPKTVRLVSIEPAGRFDLTLQLSQVDTNKPLEASVFTMQVPASATPMTLDELRQSQLIK